MKKNCNQLPDVRVYLDLTGDDFDVNKITECLNVEPNKVHVKGKTLRMDNTLMTFSSWKFGVYDPVPSYDINEHLYYLLETFQNKSDQILFLKEKYNLKATVCICIEILGTQSPAIYFEKDILNFIHSIQAEIDIDLYAFK